MSTSTGAANTTAVEDSAAEAPAEDSTDAPAGRRAAAGFAFCALFLRTGANARAADQALGWRVTEDNTYFNKWALRRIKTSR